MGTLPSLNPTIWRTFRVLANPLRLQLLRAVFEVPGRTVKDYAIGLHLRRNLVGKYLRELQARGMLSSQRKSRYIYYFTGSNPSIPFTSPLHDALRKALKEDRIDEAQVIHDLTAYTHPRRIVIVSTLAQTPLAYEDLIKATGISNQALERHLDKLERRGLVAKGLDERWLTIKPKSDLAVSLARIVTGQF